MVELLGVIGHVFAKIIMLIFNIKIENNVSLGAVVYIVICLGVLFALLHGRSGALSSEAYQPKHAYAPKHARKE